MSYVASGFSGQVKPLANMIKQGMDHPGFSIVHIQSPCTTYNDTFEELKGDPKKGIEPALWPVPDDHDTSDRGAAYNIVQQGGVPVGVIYQDEGRPSLDQQVRQTWDKAKPKTVEQLMEAFSV